jgi:hypothetical protein
METQFAHDRRMEDAQRRRLQALELQAAEQGNNTPPHILIEIEDIQNKLLGRTVPIEPISDEQRASATMRAVMLLSQQVAAVEVKVERLYWLLPVILFVYLIAEFILKHL